MNISAAIPVVLTLSRAIPAMAQNCDGILVAGMRNVAVSSSSESAVAYKYHNNCGDESQWSDDNVMAKAEVEIFGEGKGNGAFSHEQRASSLHQWCVTSKDQAEAYKSNNSASDTVYAGSVQAWSACNKLKSKDVNFDPAISNDNRSVALSITYSGNSVSGVRFYGVVAEGFDCDISSPPTPKGIEIGHEAISVTCKRKPPKAVNENGEAYEKLERGVITVKTATFPFQLYFAPEYEPTLPSREVLKITSKLAALDAKLNALTQKELTDTGASNGVLTGFGARIGAMEGNIGTLNNERVGNQVMILSVNQTCPPAWQLVTETYIPLLNDIGTPKSLQFGWAWQPYHVWLCKKS